MSHDNFRTKAGRTYDEKFISTQNATNELSRWNILAQRCERRASKWKQKKRNEISFLWSLRNLIHFFNWFSFIHVSHFYFYASQLNQFRFQFTNIWLNIGCKRISMLIYIWRIMLDFFVYYLGWSNRHLKICLGLSNRPMILNDRILKSRIRFHF